MVRSEFGRESSGIPNSESPRFEALDAGTKRPVFVNVPGTVSSYVMHMQNSQHGSQSRPTTSSLLARNTFRFL